MFNICNKNENETFAANNEKKKKLKLDEISATKKERKKDGNKQINKQTKEQTLGGCIKGLREQLTTAPGKTAVRMVSAGIQKRYNIAHSIKINRHAKA